MRAYFSYSIFVAGRLWRYVRAMSMAQAQQWAAKHNGTAHTPSLYAQPDRFGYYPSTAPCVGSDLLE